jgi:hypothetical protein
MSDLVAEVTAALGQLKRMCYRAEIPASVFVDVWATSVDDAFAQARGLGSILHDVWNPSLVETDPEYTAAEGVHSPVLNAVVVPADNPAQHEIVLTYTAAYIGEL